MDAKQINEILIFVLQRENVARFLNEDEFLRVYHQAEDSFSKYS